MAPIPRGAAEGRDFDETTVYIELADACLEGEASNSRLWEKSKNGMTNALNLQAKVETGQKRRARSEGKSKRNVDLRAELKPKRKNT